MTSLLPLSLLPHPPASFFLSFFLSLVHSLCLFVFVSLSRACSRLSRGYNEKNKRIRSNVTVTERERGDKAGGGSIIKADINRLICTSANPKVIHMLHARIHTHTCAHGVHVYVCTLSLSTCCVYTWIDMHALSHSLCVEQFHFSVTVDGVRLSPVRFVSVSPHLRYAK